MTREEKKQQIAESCNAMWALSDIWVEVDKIYDDFESRTCENCKYLKERNSYNKPIFPRHACTHADVIYVCKDNNFGCNKWEKIK